MIQFPKLGEILIKQGFVSKEQIQDALDYQKTWGGKIGDILLAHYAVTEEQLTKSLAQVSGLPAIDLPKVEISKEASQRVNSKFCYQHVLIPVMFKKINDKDHLVVAFSDPLDLAVIDEIRFMVNLPVYRVVATPSAIKSAILKVYPQLLDEVPTATDLLSLSTDSLSNDKDLESGGEDIQRNSLTSQQSMFQEKTGEFDATVTPRSTVKAFKSLAKTLRAKGLLNQVELENLLAILESKK